MDLEVGQGITMGTYADEPIHWTVREIVNGKALLISDGPIDCRKFNTEWRSMTWEGCSLRKWLNGEFLEEAFTTEERSRIASVQNSNPAIPRSGIDGGADTSDMIFCLSLDEALKFFPTDEERICKPSTQQASVRIWTWMENGASSWWLRTPGEQGWYAAFVGATGKINYFGDNITEETIGVRLAMWVAL